MALNSNDDVIRFDIKIRHAPQDVHMHMFDLHIKNAIVTVDSEDRVAKNVIIYANGDVTFDFVDMENVTE